MKLLITSLLLVSTIFAGPPPKPPPKPAPKPGSNSGSGSYPPPNTKPSGPSPPPPKPAPGSGSGSGSYPSGSPPPPSNDELCGCYNIDLICDPFMNSQGEMCYYYKIVKSSDNNYCKPIEYLSLGTGNLDECGLTSTDIASSLADYAPKCYDIDPLYDGTCNNGKVGVPGIKIKVNPPAPPPQGQSGSGSDSYPSGSQPPPPKSGSGSGSGSYPSGSPPPPPKSGSGSGSGSYPSGNGGQQPPPPPPPKESSEYMVFSICFDPLSVSGVQENGQISIKTGAGRSTCDAMDMLPNFCDEDIFFGATTTFEPESTQLNTTPAPEPADPVEATLTPTITEEAGQVNDPDHDKCTSLDALNIGFLLDESGSIDSTEWDVITQSVQRIIENDVSPESYVSLWEFASLPGYKQFLDWTGPRKDKQDKMIRTLTNNKYNPSGQTETWDAVNRVLDNFHDYKQNCDGINDKCYQRRDVLFLVTDAEPTDKAGAPRQTCPYMTDRMMATDIDVIIILVDPNGTIDPSKVSCLDSKDGGADIITIASFDDMINFESQIRDKICSGNYPLTDGERPAANPWMYDNGEYGLGPVPVRTGTGRHGKLDTEPGSGSHQASGNEENMDNMQHKHDDGLHSDGNDNNIPWMPIIAGIIFVGLLIIGGVTYLMHRSKLNNRNQEIIAVSSPGDDEEISVEDKVNQVYGNDDEGNASIIMV